VGFLARMSTATLPRPKAKRRWTYDEFAVESPESNLPTELWDGEIIISAAPRPAHQRILLRTVQGMDDYVRPRRCGEVFVSPVDVVFSGSKAVQPDVVFVSSARKSIVEENCIRGAPDLLVEIISEGTWRRDQVDKKALYEQFGVAEYWIIDPDSRLIEVFTLAKGTYRLHARGVGADTVNSKLLPGLKLAFEQLAG
jgi:Uma2 family endonuclease